MAVAVVLICLTAQFFICLPVCAGVEPGSEAQYYIQSAAEHQDPPVRRMRLVAGERENYGGRSYQWWEMTLEKPDRSVIGIRVLSERVPLTSFERIGEVRRYLFCPDPAECLEYVDAQTGKALLPQLDIFESEFLPAAFEETRFTDGFANAGRILGHTLVRSNIRPDFEAIDFSSPRVLRLRSDLLIGGQVDARDDRDETVPIDQREHTHFTKEEYREIIAAGANYFQPNPENLEWIRREPVFYRGQGVFPDDFYRSNYISGPMFIDEPAIRFGWNEWVPGTIISPEIYAAAIRMRVESAQMPWERRFREKNWFNTGAMPAFYNRVPSWETLLWTVNYQMAGGAPGLTYEGRYNRRGYEWHPETLLGDGLELLSDRQQYDFLNAFLRGAARRWNGWWGVSVYPEGDRSMMVPALCRAYDQGARALWFWNDRNLPYRWVVQVLRGLKEHIDSHPRGTPDEMRRMALVAVVLPPGYVLSCDGICGMNREELSPGGASYSDIAAAALFESILLSRAGVEFDIINDYPGIEEAGYAQLIYVREDAVVERRPKSGIAPQPVDLRMTASPGANAVALRSPATADHTIRRAREIRIDGDLSDWPRTGWIEMKGPEFWFGDNYRTELRITIPDDVHPGMNNSYIGFEWDEISDEYRDRYLLEGFGGDQVVVTSVTPDSPADRAGLREGDVIRYINEKWIRWPFEVWGRVDAFKRTPGAEVRIQVQRNGVDNFGGDDDLSARFAFLVDDTFLYFAAEVRDDTHQQTWRGPDFWQNDSVQVGIDPIFARSDGYGEYGQEFGFALKDGKPTAWRWHGRRGKPVGELTAVRVQIKRDGGRTIYEAAVPLAELAPLSPDLWPRVGINVVVNDSDDGGTRKARLELVRKAMTAGKRLNRFRVFEFEPSDDASKLSAALLWHRRCISAGGRAELTAAVRSPGAKTAAVRASLLAADVPHAPAARAECEVPVSPEATEYTLSVRTSSPPGRYLLTVEVVGPDGVVAASDTLPVYVYR